MAALSEVIAVGGYVLCSATLLIVNKLAVHALAAPSFILFAQLLGTAVVVKAAGTLGLITPDPLEGGKVVRFFPVAVIFLSTIFMNIKSLQYANVETFMVFRFSTPLCISIADYLFLGRQLPSARSWICLLALLTGAVGYAKTDSSFEIRGYIFCSLWYAIFCVDQIYLKHVTNTVKMSSNWGHVYYSNLLAAAPLLFIFAANHSETEELQKASVGAIAAVSLSVFLGAAMSYFAWSARSLLSATSFTVVGNTCKLLTIAINMLLWEKHATPVGVACLLFCLVAAYFYQQASLRKVERVEIELEEGRQK